MDYVYEIDKVTSLQIGVQGENIANHIRLDMTKWVDELKDDNPNLGFGLVFKPYNSAEVWPYPVQFNADTNILTWVVDSSATSVVGIGYVEVRAQDIVTGLIKKTRTIPASVEDSVSGIEVNPPEMQEAFVTEVINNALKSEGFAVGEQNESAVSSGSKYYHNNSKYYSEQAGASASEASTSETNAAISETNAAISATNADNAENEAMMWATGGTTPSSPASAINNAHYWSTKAGEHANDAKRWADVAQDAALYREGGLSPGEDENSITFTAHAADTHCILCYAMNMSHVFCNSLTNSMVYTDGIAEGFTLTKSGATYTLTRDTSTVFSWSVLWI